MKTLVIAMTLITVLLSPAFATTYEIVDLGTITGGYITRARDINNNGLIVGYGVTATKPNEIRALTWQNGTISNLGIGDASAVNNLGQVVGMSYGTKDHAFLWANGTMTDLGGFGGQRSMAFAINNSGLIVGRGHLEPQRTDHACMWQGTSGPVDLDPTEIYSNSSDVNDLGQIVGSYMTSDSRTRACLWYQGVKQDLGTSAYGDSTASAINNLGQVVGYYKTANGAYHPYLWQNGPMTDLGTIGNPSFYQSVDINNNGVVVGFTSEPNWLPWFWENGTMKQLPSLTGGWCSPSAINDQGVIVGWENVTVGYPHAVMWIPGPDIPEPSSIFALCGGITGLLAFRRRRK